MVCWVYSLELPWRGNSNEYTQHTFMIKWENFPKISIHKYLHSREFPRDSKRVWISHSKWAIHVPSYWGLTVCYFLIYFFFYFSKKILCLSFYYSDNIGLSKQIRPKPDAKECGVLSRSIFLSLIQLFRFFTFYCKYSTEVRCPNA